MNIIPHRFLVRMLYPITYVKKMPLDDDEVLLELPDKARLDHFPGMDDSTRYADVRLGWNELGLGVAIVVTGKTNYPIGAAAKPASSDGVAIWIDTRGDRTSHRATRTCHQFYLLPTGGGDNNDEPTIIPTKINRAIQDAPLASDSDIPFVCERTKTGYEIKAFFSAAVLNGYDPEQYPRLGFFYSIRDFELGTQSLAHDDDFPYPDDPSLWCSIDLKKA